MTEADWLTCDDPTPMLEFMRGRASDRKLRLFTIACCREVWPLLIDSRSRRAVEAAERFVEEQASLSDLAAATEASGTAGNELYYGDRPTLLAAFAAIWTAAAPDREDYPANVARLLSMVIAPSRVIEHARDIFSNPFRPTRLDETWRTATAVALAQGIYADRAFNHMPILADALEEAGCTNRATLDHCRNGGDHVRGCWVVDWLLRME